eukprot:evm.model.scf_1286.2 EVM.evm.TU.scf_1286.2   scf_1286:13730-14401(+)
METCRKANPKVVAPGGPAPSGGPEFETEFELPVRFDDEAQHVCDYQARKDAGERSRMAGLRREKCRKMSRSYAEGHRERGNSLKVLGHGAKAHFRRVDAKKYAASVSTRCRSSGFVPSLEVTWEDIEGSESTPTSESDASGEGGLAGMPEWMREEMAREDELMWALAASVAANRTEGDSVDGGVEGGAAVPDGGACPSVCSSEGWEVVDATFDVRSVDDFELR